MDLAGPAGGNRELQRINRLIAGVKALHYPQPGLTFGVAHLCQQRHLIGLAADQHGLRLGGIGIAQGIQQGPEEQFPLQPQALGWVATDAELSFPQLLPGFTQGFELRFRGGDIGAGIGFHLGPGLLRPALTHLLDVVRQNALEVVGGIKLVGVADSW